MTVANFKKALVANYEDYGGPFNWLVQKSGQAVFRTLQLHERYEAQLYVFDCFRHTILTVSDGTTPAQKILRDPFVCTPLFILTLVTTILHHVDVTQGGAYLHIGDCVLPTDLQRLQKLKRQLEDFKAKAKESRDPWILALEEAWGPSGSLTWIDEQIAFLMPKISLLLQDADPSELSDSQARAVDETYEKTVLRVEADRREDAAQEAEIRDLYNLSWQDALSAFDRYSGLSGVKRSLEKLVHVEMYRKARSESYGTVDSGHFHNFVISGPPGVGKTTAARLAGRVLVACELVPTKRITFTTTSKIIGNYVGMTEKNMQVLFDDNRGGIIVIDEADALTPDSMDMAKSYNKTAVDALNALIGYEKDNKTGTIVILTGYQKGIERLLRGNEGLRRRFPNQLSIPAYDESVMRSVMSQIIDARSYKATPDMIEGALKQLILAKDHMAARFGNAGTIEEYIDVIEAGRAQKLSIEKLKDFSKNAPLDLADATFFSQLSSSDVARFHKSDQTFIYDHLSDVSSLESTKILRFDSTRRDSRK